MMFTTPNSVLRGAGSNPIAPTIFYRKTSSTIIAFSSSLKILLFFAVKEQVHYAGSLLYGQLINVFRIDNS